MRYNTNKYTNTKINSYEQVRYQDKETTRSINASMISNTKLRPYEHYDKSKREYLYWLKNSYQYVIQADRSSDLTGSDQQNLNEYLSDIESEYLDNEEKTNEVSLDNNDYYIKDLYVYKDSTIENNDWLYSANSSPNSSIYNDQSKTVSPIKNTVSPIINTDKSQSIINGLWPAGTIAVCGDSILNNIDQNRLSRKRNVKVFNFPGCNVMDMYDYTTNYT